MNPDGPRNDSTVGGLPFGSWAMLDVQRCAGSRSSLRAQGSAATRPELRMVAAGGADALPT